MYALDSSADIDLAQPASWDQQFSRTYKPTTEAVIKQLQSSVDDEDDEPFSIAVVNLVRFLQQRIPLTPEHVNLLVQLLYNALFSGDKILSLQSRICSVLCTLLRRYRHCNAIEHLEWRPLFELLHKHHRRDATLPPSAGTDVLASHRVMLRSLIMLVRRFLPASAPDEIGAELFSSGAGPHNLSFYIDLALFELFMPGREPKALSTWAPQLLERLRLIDPSQAMVTCALSYLSRAAKASYLEQTLDFQDIIPTAFQWFLQQMPLRLGSIDSSNFQRASRSVWPMELNWLLPSGGQASFMAKLAAYSISPSSPTLDLLHQFLQTVALAYHPSNAGPWSNALGTFLSHFSKHFARRYFSEQTDKGNVPPELSLDALVDPTGTTTITEAVIEALLPPALHALYSKQPRMGYCAQVALRHLAYVLPSRVFPALLGEISENLSEQAQSHRTLSSLSLGSSIIHPLLHRRLYPQGAQHLSPLMWASLCHINPNHIMKAITSLYLCGIVLYTVPLLDATNTQVTEAPDEDDMSYEDARHATLCFKDWSLAFIGKVLSFLQHVDKLEKTSSLDVGLSRVIFRSFRVFFSNLSASAHKQAVEAVMSFVCSNRQLSGVKYYGMLMRACAFGYPEQALSIALVPLLELLCPVAQQSVNDALKQLPQTDCVWLLYMCAQLVFACGGPGLTELSARISNIALAAMQSDAGRDVRKMGRKLLRNMLKALTHTYPTEYRPASPADWESTSWCHWQSWSCFLDDPSRIQPLQEDIEPKFLAVSWHVPSSSELSAVQSIVLNVVERCQTTLQSSLFCGDSELQAESALMQLMDLRCVFEGTSAVSGTIQGEEVLRTTDPEGLFGGEIGSPPLQVAGVHWRTFLLQLTVSAFERLQSLSGTEPHTELSMVLISMLDHVLNVVQLSKANIEMMYSTSRSVRQTQREFASGRRCVLRPLLVEHAHILYLLRCASVRSSFGITQQVIDGVAHLERLATSDYKILRQQATKVIGRTITAIRQLRHTVIQRAASLLSSRNERDQAVLGAGELLRSTPISKWCVRDWRPLSAVVLALCDSAHHKDDVVQAELHHLFMTLVPQLQNLPLTSNGVSMHADLVTSLLSLVSGTDANPTGNGSGSASNGGGDSQRLHWRSELMVARFLQALIRQDAPLPHDLLLFFVQRCTCDFAPLRRMSLATLRMLCHGFAVEGERVKSVPAKFVSSPTNADLVGKSELNYFSNAEGWIMASRARVHPTGSEAVPLQRGLISVESRDALASLVVERMPALLSALEDDHPVLNAKMNQSSSRDTGTAAVIAAGATGAVSRRSHWPKTSIASIREALELEHCELVRGLLRLCPSLCAPFVQAAQQLYELSAKDTEQYHSRELQLTAAEIWAAILRALTNSDAIENRDEVMESMSKMLAASLASCSSDMIKDWAAALRFAVTDTDPRRIEWLTSMLVESALPASLPLSSTSPLQVFKRLAFLQATLVEIAWRGTQLSIEVMQRLAACPQPNDLPHMFVSPYNQVRMEVARLLYLLLRCQFRVSRSAPNEPVSFIVVSRSPHVEKLLQSLSDRLTPLAAASWPESTSSEENNALETVLNWCSFNCMFGDATYTGDVLLRLLPIVCSACHHPNAETAAQGRHALHLLAWTEFQGSQVSELVTMVVSVSEWSSWHVRGSLLSFVQTAMIRHSFLLTTQQVRTLRKLVESLLKDPQLEVRELASQCLTSIILCSAALISIDKMIKRFIRLCQTKVVKGDTSSFLSRHAGVLGLSALVRSDPYDVPRWMPRVLAFLSDYVHDPNPIGGGLQKVLGEFRRTHTDAWHLLKQRFEPDQLTKLNEATIAPSYFA